MRPHAARSWHDLNRLSLCDIFVIFSSVPGNNPRCLIVTGLLELFETLMFNVTEGKRVPPHVVVSPVISAAVAGNVPGEVSGSLAQRSNMP
jgi:hypothetical protein